MANLLLAARSIQPGCSVAILTAGLALAACVNPPEPLPIKVKERATIASVRASWRTPPDSGTQAFSPGVELAYERGLGQGDQRVGMNEFIRLDNKVLSGPQDVRHYTDLSRGHLAFNGLARSTGTVFEVELIAGLGQARLGLRSESQTNPADTLATTFSTTGVVLGVGPRLNFTDNLALEARFQNLYSSLSSDPRFWHREIALRYRPVKTVAVRAGYAEMDYGPSQPRGNSPINVRLYGPLLGLDLVF